MKQQIIKLWRLLSPRDRRNAGILLLLMVAAAILEVVGVAAIPAFVGAVVQPERAHAIGWVGDLLTRLGLDTTEKLMLWGALALAALFAIKTAFLVFNFHLQVRFTLNRRIELARRMLRAYLVAPYPFHLTRNRAELLRNVDQETNAISAQVIGVALQLLTKLFILVAVLGFLLVMEPLITVFWLMLFGSLAAFVVINVGARLRRHGRREQVERGLVMKAIYQALGGIKETRVLGRERFFLDRVDESMHRLAAVSGFRQTVQRSIPPVTEFAAIIGLLLLTVALLALNRPSETIVVTLSLFVVALVRLRETMSAAMGHVANLRFNLVSVDPVYDDLAALENAPRRPFGSLDAPRTRMKEGIALRDVRYRYETASGAALRNVNIAIPAGAAVGFVGSTGAGKSTLIDIILGLLEPQSGAVLVDGVDIRQSGVGEWQRAIGYVPQSIYLMDDTLRCNVALGVQPDKIDDASLWRALRAAQLEPLLNRLPDGLNTIIGEQGVRLSGGERQRIGIARALYHDPDVLVLDEATSALDNATERAIVQAVEALKGQRTVITVAHRLSTVRNCDKLYFMKEGRVEAEGSYQELQAMHADFAAMASA